MSNSATVTPRTVNFYSLHDKEEALRVLARCDGNCRNASRLTGIPWTTLRGWTQQMPETFEFYWDEATKNKRQEALPLPDQTDPNPLLADLKSKANLLLGALTPERLAAAPLTHVARALAVILPRIQALEKAATTYADAQADRDFHTQIGYVLRRHIENRDLLHAILTDLDRLADIPNDIDDIPEDAPATVEPPTPANLSDSPLPASLSERPGEGPGVRSPEPPPAPRSPNAMSEMSERDTDAVDAPALPPSLERGTSGREGGPGGLGRTTHTPPTLEQLRAIQPTTRWAGAP